MSPKIGDLLKVTRDDIQDFPGDTIDLIMQLQKNGWRAQRSNRNHVMLFAPDGEARYSASRNSNSAKYLAEDVRRYEKSKNIPEKVEVEYVEVKVITEKHPCPKDDCPRVFNSEENLKAHFAVDHEGKIMCPEEGCFEALNDKRHVGIHLRHKHGKVSPRNAERKRQEAAKAAREVEAEAEKLDSDTDVITETIGTGVYSPVTAADAWKDVGFLDSQPVFELQDIEDDEERAKKAEEIAKRWVAEAEEKERCDDLVVGRESWVLDMKDLLDMPVETVLKNMYAAGLGMEIRVWKEE